MMKKNTIYFYLIIPALLLFFFPVLSKAQAPPMQDAPLQQADALKRTIDALRQRNDYMRMQLGQKQLEIRRERQRIEQSTLMISEYAKIVSSPGEKDSLENVLSHLQRQSEDLRRDSAGMNTLQSSYEEQLLQYEELKKRLVDISFKVTAIQKVKGDTLPSDELTQDNFFGIKARNVIAIDAGFISDYNGTSPLPRYYCTLFFHGNDVHTFRDVVMKVENGKVSGHLPIAHEKLLPGQYVLEVYSYCENMGEKPVKTFEFVLH